jgi:hypothetical protein
MAPDRVERRLHLKMPKARQLPASQRNDLLKVLNARFDANPSRHRGIAWNSVRARLDLNPSALWSLAQMEDSGGEPDVIGIDRRSGAVIFVDCSAQSPKGRRSLCYDKEALDSRKENKPKDSAVAMAAAMGVELLTVEEYEQLQTLAELDTTTSSWVQTPAKIRKLGGALFCDRRYDTVFIYHNGAESYYANRGFRCSLKV